MPSPCRYSSPTSPPDVLQLAHMMDFGVLGRAAGFAHPCSHATLQLRIVDIRRRGAIIEDGLVLSLQRQATELDLDGPFSLPCTAYLETDAAFPVWASDRRTVLSRYSAPLSTWVERLPHPDCMRSCQKTLATGHRQKQRSIGDVLAARPAIPILKGVGIKGVIA